MSELTHATGSAPTPASAGRIRTRQRARRRRAWIRRGLLIAAAAAALGLLIRAFLPEPVPVDVDRVERGPMQVAVIDDGRTRVVHRYVVSAPVSGRLTRITLRPGDPVDAGGAIARVTPAAAPLLDARSRAEATARLGAAEARVRQSRALVDQARTRVTHTRAEAERIRALAASGVSAEQPAIRAEYEARAAADELAAVDYGARVAAQDVAAARAVLEARPDDLAGGFPVSAPIAGQVLRVFQESETVVAAGTPLVEVGDPAVLEVVVDVLSRDAVRIRPGARAWIEQWGGDAALAGRVRRVEPAAFTRVSALGIEEQRVNVVIGFDQPLPPDVPLGDGYRVEARIVEWEATEVLRAPASAVFRAGDGWAVFAVDGRRVRRVEVTIGRRNDEQVEVSGGIDAGTEVILHPGDRIADGVRVAPRAR
ncbi:MAG TPA: HlyD family efflux transporter periplasmic adaptor subunit [Kofleriaceae bacterium]|nr:HlyD family efflux transporter periplasmic adaptor subunit [Kofleriaceae bacterium]